MKNNFHIFNFLAIAFAANKSDMYEMEEVEEEKGRAFAKEIGGIFKYTSAKTSTGIDELFRTIGNKFLDPNYEDSGMGAATSSFVEEAINERRQTVRISKDSAKQEKGGCCSK